MFEVYNAVEFEQNKAESSKNICFRDKKRSF